MRYSFDGMFGASSKCFEFGDIAIGDSYSIDPFMPHIPLPHVVASVDFSVVWIFVGKERGILSMALTLFEDRDSTLKPNVFVPYVSNACEFKALCAIVAWVVPVELGVNFCFAPVGVNFVVIVLSFLPVLCSLAAGN